MDEEIRQSFETVFTKLDNIQDRVTKIQVTFSERLTKAETVLDGHLKNGKLHAAGCSPEGGENDKIDLRFKFPRRLFMALFYVALALFGGLGLKDVLRLLVNQP